MSIKKILSRTFWYSSFVAILAAIGVHLFDPVYGQFSLALESENYKSGKEIYAKNGCQACHGDDGQEPAADAYPRIDGQSAEYLLQQMKDIKSGARANGSSMSMQTMIQNISDRDLELIAAYLSEVGR